MMLPPGNQACLRVSTALPRSGAFSISPEIPGERAIPGFPLGNSQVKVG